MTISIRPASASPLSVLSQPITDGLPRSPSRQDYFLENASPWLERVVEVESYDGAETYNNRYSGSGMTTATFDDPVDEHFEARIISCRFALAFSPSIATSRSTFSGGIVRLGNLDNDLTHLVRSTQVGNRPLCVKVGDRRDLFRHFGVAFDGTARQWFLDDQDVVLELRDVADQLREPIAASAGRFAGTGGKEGGDDLRDVFWPVSFGGRHENVPLGAFRLNTLNIYAVSFHTTAADGSGTSGIYSILAVYDRGVELTAAASPAFADYDALAAATVASGEFAYVLDDGGKCYLRTGDEPDGQLTVTFETTGDAVLPGSIMREILFMGGLQASRIDEGALNTLDVELPISAELYVADGARIAADIADEFLRGLSCVWGTRATGTVFAGLVRLPVGEIERTFTDADILGLSRIPIPADFAPYVRAARVGYRRNYFVQETDLDANIEAAHRDFISREYRFQGGSSSGLDPNGIEIEALSGIDGNAGAAGASTLVSHYEAVWTDRREMIRIRVGHPGLFLSVLQEIRIVSNRYSINGYGRILGIDVDLEINEISILLLMGD